MSDTDDTTALLTGPIADAMGWRIVPHTNSIDRGTGIYLCCKGDRPAIVCELILPALLKCKRVAPDPPAFLDTVGYIWSIFYTENGRPGTWFHGTADTVHDSLIIAVKDLIEGGWKP